MLDEPLVPMPEKGRVFRSRRRVRLADAGPSGRLRLDACARYLQDLGNDDTADSGLDEVSGVWVVRRAVVDLLEPPRFGQWVDLATWCGGTGRRWAERRLALTGDSGGEVQITTLWVHLDAATMAPALLPETFMEIYGEAAGDRRVSSKRWLRPPPAGAEPERQRWPLRVVDYDVLRHLNNAAYWAAVEEVLAQRQQPFGRKPVRAVMEYGPGIAMGSTVDLLVSQDGDRLDIWFSVDGGVQATACVVPLNQGQGQAL